MLKPSRTQRWQAGGAAGIALGLGKEGGALAAGRWALLAVAAEAFAVQGTPIKAAVKAVVAEEEEEVEQPPILHWVPQLRVRLTADRANYSAARRSPRSGGWVATPPPLLFLRHKINALGQPDLAQQHYDVASGSWGYVPHLYIDELWLQQRWVCALCISTPLFRMCRLRNLFLCCYAHLQRCKTNI